MFQVCCTMFFCFLGDVFLSEHTRTNQIQGKKFLHCQWQFIAELPFFFLFLLRWIIYISAFCLISVCLCRSKFDELSSIRAVVGRQNPTQVSWIHKRKEKKVVESFIQSLDVKGDEKPNKENDQEFPLKAHKNLQQVETSLPHFYLSPLKAIESAYSKEEQKLITQAIYTPRKVLHPTRDSLMKNLWFLKQRENGWKLNWKSQHINCENYQKSYAYHLNVFVKKNRN